MPQFSEKSMMRLKSCHSDLQKIFLEVIKHYDCTILCGHRTKEEQDDCLEKGTTTKKFPFSKHNQTPSMALDAMPYPINWKDRERLMNFVGFVQGIATMQNIKIRVGADWNGDRNFKNDSFFDGPHFELV